MAYTPVSVVQVHAFTHRVGALAYNPSNRYYAFEYDPNWIRTGIQIAPLTMPLRRGPMTFPNLPETTYYRLPAAIAGARAADAWGYRSLDWLHLGRGVRPCPAG